VDDVLRIDLAEIARLRDAGFTAVELIRLVDVTRRHQREQMLKRVAGRRRLQFVRWLVRHGWFRGVRRNGRRVRQ